MLYTETNIANLTQQSNSLGQLNIMIKKNFIRLFDTIKLIRHRFVHELPITFVLALFVLMLSPFDAIAQTNPTLTIEDIEFAESSGDVTITVILNEAVDSSFTVTVSAGGGTAIGSGSIDYDAPDQTLNFDGNANESQTFDITITDDDIVEGDEDFIVTLNDDVVLENAGSTVTITATDTAEVTITDDDAAVVTIAGLATVSEGAGNVVITAQLVDNPVAASFDVTIATSDGTADAGDDYTVPD